MKLLIDILQGIGLSAAVGIRPFLPTLVVGAFATADVGVDYEGTAFSFLEAPAFLLAVAIVMVLTFLLRSRFETPVGLAALQGISIGLGAIIFAATLDDRNAVWWPGLIAGLLIAALAATAVRDLFGRVRGRLDREAAAALPIYAEGLAVAVAALAILLPPLSLVAVGFLVWLLAGGRRREGEKYAGLRILR
jgi:uncharacterized protein DUF4126